MSRPRQSTKFVGRLLFSTCAAICATLPVGGSRAEAPFEPSPILSQPFEKQPFQAVRVPDWLQETLGCGYTLSAMDSKARVAAAAHGVTISEMGFVDPFYAYYDSKLLKRRSPHVPLDRLPKDLAEYRRLGVRILGVYPPTLQGEVYETHPEWRRISTDTKTIPQVDMKKHPYGGMLCLLGPYGDFFIDVLAEILERFPEVDAFSFDGLHHGGVCYCQHCRTNYRQDNGAEIPKADLNDVAFRRYQHWADRRLEDVIHRMQVRLKAIKPDVALVTWTTNAGRFGHFLSVPRNMPSRMNLLLDAPDQEFWLDETNRGASIVPAFSNAYMWATTNHRVAFSEPYLMSHGNPYGRDSFPPEEILRRMLLSLTYGTMPSIAVAQPKSLQEDVYKCMDEIQRRKAWITHKTPEPWCGLVLSDNTRNFYGRSSGLVEDRYMAAVFGAFRAAVEEHLPVAVLNDWNLTDADLSRFKVLVLPNTAALDDRQIQSVRRFVATGGGLVASLDTSLFDEFGSPREQFGLADVLGVDFKGLPSASVDNREEIDVNFAKSLTPDYWEKRKNSFDLRLNPGSFLMRGRVPKYVGDSTVTFKGPAVRVAPRPGAKTLGAIRAKSADGAPEMPAIIANEFGKGKVVYFSAGIDSAYYLYAYPYQRLLLREAMLWAAAESPPITVQAPMCVHATLMRQTKNRSDRLIVHLFNDLNTTAFHAHPRDDVPLREETVPIYEIAVTFKETYRIARVHLEPEGKDLPMERLPTGVRVLVPKLDVHSMVVAELGVGLRP